MRVNPGATHDLSRLMGGTDGDIERLLIVQRDVPVGLVRQPPLLPLATVRSPRQPSGCCLTMGTDPSAVSTIRASSRIIPR